VSTDTVLSAGPAAILFFRCADIFSGKRRETAYNLAQKSAAFLQKRVLASQQRLLCRAAKRGSADHCRILPYELHAIRHIVQPNLYAVMPRNTNLLQHVWTPVAQITPALPMDSVIRLPRRVLMPSNPDLNDPVCT